MKRIELPVFLLLFSLILSSCSPTTSPLPPTPTTTVPAAANNTPTQTSQPATNVPTQTPYVITATPQVVTSTPALIQAEAATEAKPVLTATLQPNTTECNKAGFVSDITVPNGTAMAVTQVFVKTWRLINLGTCTWTSNYQIIPVQGGSSQQAFNLGVSVPPGHYVDISIKVTAPATEGTYGSSYKLESPDGVIFGVGADGNSAFGYLVDVQNINTPSSFRVTNVDMSINTSSVDVSCPSGKKFVFLANISVNGPGTVTYHWVFSNGDTSGKETLTFDEEGSQSVSTSWTLGSKKDVSPNPFSGWAQLYVNSPNNQSFGRVHFSITCH